VEAAPDPILRSVTRLAGPPADPGGRREAAVAALALVADCAAQELAVRRLHACATPQDRASEALTMWQEMRAERRNKAAAEAAERTAMTEGDTVAARGWRTAAASHGARLRGLEAEFEAVLGIMADRPSPGTEAVRSAMVLDEMQDRALAAVIADLPPPARDVLRALADGPPNRARTTYGDAAALHDHGLISDLSRCTLTPLGRRAAAALAAAAAAPQGEARTR